MKNTSKLFTIICIILLVTGVALGVILLGSSISRADTSPTTTTTVRFVNSTISADGVVTAQNQAKLNFQTGGKLVRLPFKEGDKVSVGQTIAQLDTYALQRQLTVALNTYRSTRDTFDQTQQNAGNNVSNHQLTPTYNGAGSDTTDVINDAVKRIVDQNQASLDNSVVNVELANYALQLSRLTSPIQGVITHQDVTVAGVNITPTTTFTVADPTSMVFRANVPASNIDYVTVGSSVSLAIDGIPDKVIGTVSKIYPSKITLTSGQSFYQVDIQSDQLKQQAKLDEAGTAIISTNSENVALAPSWTILGGEHIWVDNNGIPELRQVTTGKVIGNETEIISGLSADEQIIIDPQYISRLKYSML